MFDLPRPSEFGTYWFGPRTCGPAIFPSKRLVETRHEKRAEPNGTYILFLNPDDGFVFEDGRLKQFKTASEALCELNKR